MHCSQPGNPVVFDFDVAGAGSGAHELFLVEAPVWPVNLRSFVINVGFALNIGGKEKGLRFSAE